MKWQWILAGALATALGCSTAQYSWITHTWTTAEGVFAMDHVSRKLVDVTAAVQRRYLGEVYYFESERNASTFDSNPWAYLYTDNVHLQGRPDRSDQN